ncbi:hypothetical protein EVAR_50292_1 [Eumeta japonica]|uniref:Uncharacterized protein n=1 Tax=Eumeta variegata TaxID=151549 RepID=A0A4C1XSB6_EUMVA|nr:hypothetical protein EVAR_50292_1 [Eumeta japonica]
MIKLANVYFQFELNQKPFSPRFGDHIKPSVLDAVVACLLTKLLGTPRPDLDRRVWSSRPGVKEGGYISAVWSLRLDTTALVIVTLADFILQHTEFRDINIKYLSLGSETDFIHLGTIPAKAVDLFVHVIDVDTSVCESFRRLKVYGKSSPPPSPRASRSPVAGLIGSRQEYAC